MSRTARMSSAELEKTAADWVFRLDAGLTPEEEAEFKVWEASDPSHAAAIVRHKRAWSVLDHPRNSGQADYLLRKLSQRASHRRRQRVGVAVAMIALLFTAGAFWRMHRPAVVDTPAAHAVLVVPEKQILPDGSVVELKSGAEVVVDFAGSFRRVVLKAGEAHFRVAKNKDRPFVVIAGNVEFRAVGTAFSVQLDAWQVELLVTEGRVAVEKPSEDRPIGPLSASSAGPATIGTVAAGQRLVVELAPKSPAQGSVPIAVPSNEIADRLAWLAPRLEFTDTPLAQAVALMNQRNRVQLIIEGASLKRLEVSGLFRADRTEAFVRLLEANFGVKAESSGDTIVLRRAP